MANHQIIRWGFVVLTALSFAACQKSLLKAELETYKLMYKPGEHLVASFEETKKRSPCTNDGVYLKESFFRPHRMVAGEQILTRFIYASCAAMNIRGIIVRKVIHNGSVILRDTTPHSFIPGTWGVNAYIQIPPDATAGAYIFLFTITAGSQVFKETHTFQVIQP
jgi:hypothetical protein